MYQYIVTLRLTWTAWEVQGGPRGRESLLSGSVIREADYTSASFRNGRGTMRCVCLQTRRKTQIANPPVLWIGMMVEAFLGYDAVASV